MLHGLQHGASTHYNYLFHSLFFPFRLKSVLSGGPTQTEVPVQRLQDRAEQLVSHSLAEAMEDGRTRVGADKGAGGPAGGRGGD
jgi:hypothetical protein